MTKLSPAIVLTLILAMVLVPAIAGQLDRPDGLRFEVQGDTAFVDGTSTSRSQNAVRRLLRDNPQVTRLVFRSMPGTVDVTTNYHLARTIREAGLTTELTAGSRIASGAVDLFLAGERRIVACGAMIGVHAWGSAGYDAQDVMFDPHRRMSRRFLSDMGVDPDFYDFRTDAAGTEEIHWMNDAEIARWGVATEPRPACN